MTDVWDGITIGGACGFAASIMFSLCQHLTKKLFDYQDTKKIYKWLEKNSKDAEGERFRSTRAIASWNNLSEDRVRSLCYVSSKIFLSTGKNDGLWSIYDRNADVVPKVINL